MSYAKLIRSPQVRRRVLRTATAEGSGSPVLGRRNQLTVPLLHSSTAVPSGKGRTRRNETDALRKEAVRRMLHEHLKERKRKSILWLPVPAGPSSLTLEYLQVALGPYIASTLQSFEVRPVGEIEGFMSVSVKVSLCYSEDVPLLTMSDVTAERSDDVPVVNPSSVFCKFSHVECTPDLISIYQREINFYEKVAGVTPVTVPLCLHHHEDSDGNFLLILEDVVACRGAVPGDQAQGCDQVHISNIVTQMAMMHAKWWDDERLKTFNWLPYHAQDGGESDDDEERTEDLRMKLKSGIWALQRLLLPQEEEVCEEDGEGKHTMTMKRTPPRLELDVPAGFAEILHCASECLFDVEQSLHQRFPVTLVHGDLRLDNVMLRRGVPYIIDWQTCVRGCGLYDFAYFIVYDVAVETRRRREMEWLREYAETLKKYCPAVDITFEDVEDMYDLALWHCLRHLGNGALFWLSELDESPLEQLSGTRNFEMCKDMFVRLSSALVDRDGVKKLRKAHAELRTACWRAK